MPSFPGMVAPPCFAALPHLSCHAATHSNTKTDNSLNRLEMLGMNKPRSNSIPNFQTSSKFASLFNNPPASTGGSRNTSTIEDSKDLTGCTAGNNGESEETEKESTNSSLSLPSYLTSLNRTMF